jgi:glycerol-3-phosphate acyltransferase PlsY
MNPSLLTLAVIVAAYLIGSVSFAVVVSKLFRLPDPHSYGSGNPGATNVLRTGNKAAAALTLAGDAAKGAIAVGLAHWVGATWGDASLATAGAAVAVFVGHLYPIFHRFSGGKGVATAAEAWALIPIALLLAWRHRGNIQRIVAGKERKFGG